MDLFRSPTFDSRVKQLIDKHHIPGIALAITQYDEIVSAAYGLASVKYARSMTTDTLFDIASASKSLTAASVALFVEDNNHPDVKYDARMSDLLPGDFEMPGEDHNGVTLDDLLGHRTGLASNDYAFLGPNAKRPDDARSVTRKIRDLLLQALLRTEYVYCNAMYTVASYLVEQRSGLSFSEYLHRHFFHPLEMTSTSLQPKEARAKGLGDRICQGHLWEDDEQEYMAFDFPDTPEGQGAGSIITSVNDYIKYVKAVMDQRPPFTEPVYKGIMKERTIMGLETEKPYPFSSPRIYAAGWRLHYYRGYQVVAHQGGIPGCSTTHLFLPDLKFGCVIFANAGGADSVISILVHELIDEVLKVPQDQRLDWEQVEKTMSYEEEITGPATVAHGESLPSSNPGQPRPQERPLSSYTGEYRHPGYGSIEVRVKEGQLFVDANDRSLAVEMNFEFLPEETKFVAYLSRRTEGICDRVPAGLRFDDNGCSWLGIELDEPKILVWFERVRGEDSRQQSRT